jgi:hypothetical protein
MMDDEKFFSFFEIEAQAVSGDELPQLQVVQAIFS